MTNLDKFRQGSNQSQLQILVGFGDYLLLCENILQKTLTKVITFIK